MGRTLMEAVMKALNEGTDAIAKASEKPKAATGVAKPIQPNAATAGNAEENDDDESQTEAKTGASGAAAAASAGSSEDGDEDEDTSAAQNPTGAATGSSTGGSSSDADDAELEKKAARLMKSMPAEEASTDAASGGAGSATGNPAMKAMLDQLKAINSTLASHGKMMREMGNASKGGNWSATITIDDGRTGSKSNESTTPKTDAEVEAESGSAGSAASGPAASGPAPAANSGASGPEKTVKPIIEGESGAAAKSGASGASSSGASGPSSSGASGAGTSGASESGASGASSSGASGASGASSSGASGASSSGASG